MKNQSISLHYLVAVAMLTLTGCAPQFIPTPDLIGLASESNDRGPAGGGHSGDGGGSIVKPVCVPGTPNISQKKIRRLTSAQIKSVTLKAYNQDNRMKALDYAAFDTAIAELGFTGESEKTSMDGSGLARWLDSVNRLNLNAFSAMGPISAACKANFTASGCIEDQMTKYAIRLLRRPATAQEVADVREAITRIRAKGASIDLQVGFLHKYLLFNPSFFHRTEVGISANSTAKVVEMDNYEIASFLSYSIIDDAPDDSLYAKAQAGQLKNLNVIEDEVIRLTAMPAAKETVKNILSDFLKLNKVTSVAGNKFSKYTNDSNFSIPLATRKTLDKQWHDQSFRVKHTSLANDLQSFLNLRIGNNLNYMNIFSGNVFPVTNRTIAIYGVRDKASLDSLFAASNPDPTNMHYIFETQYTAKHDERHGIFSHPAYMTVHSKENDTGMVHRGVFFMEQVLCYKMPGAPANVFPSVNLPPNYDPTKLTSRKKFEILHSQQTGCFGCHQTIDNIGGSFESFDQTGYFQKTETFKYMDKFYTLNVDSSGKLMGPGSINISYANTVDFLKKITETPDFKKCVNKRLLEYIVGELSNSVNSCDYDVKASMLASDKDPTFRDLILANFTDSNFFKRRTEGGQ